MDKFTAEDLDACLEKVSGRARLQVVRELDRIWRGKMLPCCPHCGDAIAPEDGLGRSCTSKTMELERRKFKKGGN